ncbi:MAG: hypothetical protein ABI575_09905 [Oxalobacteraceae bacterium]
MNDRLILTSVANDGKADAIARARQLADLAQHDTQLTDLEKSIGQLAKLSPLTDKQ